MEKIALDVHKRYSFVSVDDGSGGVVEEGRINHERGAIRSFLERYRPGTPVAVEATGHWYWVVDEIEQAGLVPRLVHAGKAKVMMGCLNKTDRLDARGLNRLQRAGTLPTVWIPPGEVRDQRELPRTRMYLVSQRTDLKNRIHGTLAKYGLSQSEVRDLFGKRGRVILAGLVAQLPRHAAAVVRQQLVQVDSLQVGIAELEEQIKSLCEETPAVRLLQSMPGVGFVLGVVIAWEVGDVGRFARCEKLAAYAGTTPRVHASGGRQRQGRLRSDVNHYLKWAFIEAANCVANHAEGWPGRHVAELYLRLREKRGHSAAAGAVARHLAEATYWILTKQERYRQPADCLQGRTSAATL